MFAGLPGLAALVALFFTYQQVNATNVQLRIAEQGQITDRYNAAITNLGSRSIDVRLGGIYALQRLMKDSPRDQPTVIAVLCAFVRDRAAEPAKPPTPRQPTDIQAALTVVGTRNTAEDGGATVVDFDHAELAIAQLSMLHLSRANFSGAGLSGADLYGAVLRGANLTGAVLRRADLSDADLSDAHLSGALLSGANLRGAHLSGALLSGATLTGADLFSADLSSADLSGATLSGADLFGANLFGAILRGADLRGANLTHANLSGANLTGARLTRAFWPDDVVVPNGWKRSNSGQLSRG